MSLTAALVSLLLAQNTEVQRRLAAPPSHGGKVVSVATSTHLGLTAGVTSTGGGDANERMGTLSVSMERTGYVYDRGLIVRLVNATELGGDRRGFHGGIAGGVSGGYRFAVTETQGPFVRGGLEVLLAGDALVYQSLLELPQVHAGYQYLSGSTLLEIAPRTGFAMLGASNTGEHASRSLDVSLDVGALGTIQAGPLVVRATWSRFLARGAGGPIDWLGFGLCSKARIAVCTVARFVEGDVHLAGGEVRASHVAQVGLTLGFGHN